MGSWKRQKSGKLVEVMFKMHVPRSPQGSLISNYRLLCPSKVTRPFEGQGQLDSNEIKVMGSHCG